MYESRPAIPEELKRRLFVESGHRCAIPQCGHNANIDIHHIVPWSQCKAHDFNNLIVLCPNCHRLVHDGKIDRKSLFEYKKRLSSNLAEVSAHDPGLDRSTFTRLAAVLPKTIFYTFKSSSFGDHRTMDFLQPVYKFIELCGDPTFVFRTEEFEREKLLLKNMAIDSINYISPCLWIDDNNAYRIGPTEGSLGSDVEAMCKWSSVINEATFKMYDFFEKYDQFVSVLTTRLA